MGYIHQRNLQSRAPHVSCILWFFQHTREPMLPSLPHPPYCLSFKLHRLVFWHSISQLRSRVKSVALATWMSLDSRLQGAQSNFRWSICISSSNIQECKMQPIHYRHISNDSCTYQSWRPTRCGDIHMHNYIILFHCETRRVYSPFNQSVQPSQTYNTWKRFRNQRSKWTHSQEVPHPEYQNTTDWGRGHVLGCSNQSFGSTSSIRESPPCQPGWKWCTAICMEAPQRHETPIETRIDKKTRRYFPKRQIARPQRSWHQNRRNVGISVERSSLRRRQVYGEVVKRRFHVIFARTRNYNSTIYPVIARLRTVYAHHNAPSQMSRNVSASPRIPGVSSYAVCVAALLNNWDHSSPWNL